jgi:hypothetical protein
VKEQTEGWSLPVNRRENGEKVVKSKKIGIAKI